MYGSRRALRQWRPVLGWEVFYEVSDHGEVRTVASGQGRVLGRVLRSHLVGAGYLAVELRRFGTRSARRVHRLVCEAFSGAPPTPRSEVNHLNGDKLDNRATNLAWCTHHENMRHASLLGLLSPVQGEAHHRAKLVEADVLAIRTASEPQHVLAARYGVSRGLIGQIRRRRVWRHI